MTNATPPVFCSSPSRRTVWVVMGTAAAMCAVAPADWPYGFYTFLRLAVTGASLCGCIWLHRARSEWLWPCCLIVILYNPVIKVHLDRDSWVVLNVLSSLLLLAAARQLSKAIAKNPPGASAR